MDVIHRCRASLVRRPRGLTETVLAYQPLQLLTGTYGRVSQGGHLYVVPQGLGFQPHAGNLTRTTVQIPIGQVQQLRPHQSLASSLLEVTTGDGHRYNFVCWSRDGVIRAVEQARRMRATR